MNIVLNSNYQEAGHDIWITQQAQLLKDNGVTVTINDWQHYDRYDVALFMASDAQLENAREQNPKIITGIIDPKLPRDIATSMKADYLIVSSIEQRDIFLKYNQNIFIYYPFAQTKAFNKKHQNSDRIVIGYHGNKIHLNAFFPQITQALEWLADDFEVELRVIYNIEKLGKWTLGVPDSSKVKTVHVQWSPENLQQDLETIDIGIVNGLTPVRSESFINRLITYPYRLYLESKYDYLRKYKYSSNPGRIYSFAMAKVPVVADMFPSAAQFVNDNGFSSRRGMLVGSAQGWYQAFYELSADSKLRQECADNMYKYVTEDVSLDKIVKHHIDYLGKLKPENGKSIKIVRYRSLSYSKSLYVDIVDKWCRINNKISKILSRK